MRTQLALALALVLAGLTACGGAPTPTSTPATPARSSTGTRTVHAESISTLPDGTIAPATDGVASLRIEAGLEVIVNHGPLHATLEIRGTDLAHAPEAEAMTWVVDGNVLQLVAVVADQHGRPDLDGDALLLHHMRWEHAHHEQALGTRLSTQRRFIERDGRRLLAWWVDLPARAGQDRGESVAANVLVTTAAGSSVLGISTPVLGAETVDAALARIIPVVGGARVSPTFIDVAAAQARIRATRAAH